MFNLSESIKTHRLDIERGCVIISGCIIIKLDEVNNVVDRDHTGEARSVGWILSVLIESRTPQRGGHYA